MEEVKLPPVASVDDIKEYNEIKKTNSALTGVRVAKALKWYFIYTMIVLFGFYVWSNHTNVFSVLLNLNKWVIIVILGLNYGLVVISYLTSEWPKDKKIEALKKESAKADGDVVLGYIEKILIIIHLVTFYVWSPHFGFNDKTFYIASAILQAPHIITFFFRFPRKFAVFQVLMFIVRVLAQASCFLLVVALIMRCFVNTLHQAIIVCTCLAGIPMLIFLALFVRGLVLNKLFDATITRFVCVGNVQRRWVIFVVFLIALLEWVGAFLVVHFKLQKYRGNRDAHNFVVMSSTMLLAIFNIAAMYHALLKTEVSESYKSRYRMGPKAAPFFGLKDFSTVIDVNDEKGKGPELNTQIIKKMKLAKSSIQNVSLVIACFKSENNIQATLTAAIDAGFSRRNIFIAHNSKQDSPIDRTGAVTWNPETLKKPSIKPPTHTEYMRAESKGYQKHDRTPLLDSTFLPPSDFTGVRYCYINIGNKSIALQYVISNYVTTPFVMIIDDDVSIPKSIDMNGALLDLEADDNMKAIAFTIRGIDKPTIWQSFQHLEYMQAGFVKIFQADFGSVLCCHGAIALWRTNTIKEILLEHNSEFDGEDLQMGLILRRMNKEFTIGVNAVEPVPTTAPRSLLYEHVKDEKSLMVQRVFSWDMASHHFLLDFVELLLFNWERKSLILKPFLITEIWTQLQDWLRVILLFFMVADSKDKIQVLYALLILLGIQLALVFIFDRIILAHRRSLQVSRYILIFYPVYNVISLIFRFGGLLYNTLYYTPWNAPRIKIKEKMARGLIPPKVEIDDIPNELKEEYWNKIWTESGAEAVAIVAIYAARKRAKEQALHNRNEERAQQNRNMERMQQNRNKEAQTKQREENRNKEVQPNNEKRIGTRRE